MQKLEINPLFEKHFAPLDYGQEQQLEKSLKADLTSEPIFWWHNPASGQDEILDGHHRYKIAQKLKIELQTHEKFFDSEDAALLFVIRNQTTRRNLSNREDVLREVVNLEIKLGKSKTAAVEDTASMADVGVATVWRAVADEKPVNPIEAYKEAKAQFEKKIMTVKNKAAAKLKAEIVKDGLDEDAAMSQWEGIEAEIDDEYKDEIAELESLAEAAQQAGEQGVRSTGGKRGTKKSVRDRAARRNTFKKALSLIHKLRNEAFYFWDIHGCGTVDIKAVDGALFDLASAIEAEQKADAEKAAKKKFGR